MPVNYQTPSSLPAVAGVRLGTTAAGIRKPGRRDLTVIELTPQATVAGVFTRNRFCAAPVSLCRQRLAAGTGIRALVINTGCANAGTGEAGMADAIAVCAETARLLGVPGEAVLPFSTGVILERLPMDRLLAGLPAAVADLAPEHWLDAASAIMTTDTVAKGASRVLDTAAGPVTVTGIAKGAGMIRPDMATMLGFIAISARVETPVLQQVIDEVVAESFNAVTVDGDTSTNDSLILIASGHGPELDAATLLGPVREVAVELAQALVRDGEGATRFVTVGVEGGRDRAECRKVAYAIAHSPLVKTAFFAGDPNLGRILAAVGYAGIDDLDVTGVRVWLDDECVAEGGGRAPGYSETRASTIMARPEFTVRVDLGRGDAGATVWTSDLSHDYVTINAEYRS